MTPQLGLETWRAWYAALFAAGLMQRDNARLAAWFISREGVPEQDVEVFASRLREPARAAATTRLYRAYLRTLVATARGSNPPEPRLTVPTLLMIGARDMAVTPKLADRVRARRRRRPHRGRAGRRPLHLRHASAARRGPRARAPRLNRSRAALHRVRLTPEALVYANRRLLLGIAVALLALPATGHAQSGGATIAPATGGAGYGASAPGLTASRFKVTPRTLTLGAPASFRYRIDGAQRSARVRIELLAAGARRPAATIRMGWKRTRRTLIRTWTPARGRAGAR